jgi:hypothetical protein
MGASIVAEPVPGYEYRGPEKKLRLACQLAKEFALVHAVLESLAAVDEYDGDFVGELAAEVLVRFDIDFVPDKSAATSQLHQAFLDNLAQVATLTGVNQDLAGDVHGASVAVSKQISIGGNVKNPKRAAEA